MADLTINLQNFKPVKFYPYTSSVTDRIITNEPHDSDYRAYEDPLRHVWISICERAKTADIKWYNDNKTVIELENENGQKLFIGCYDHRISIGLGVRVHSW
jgi:hypothetical protein